MQHYLFLLIFILSCSGLWAQERISGKVVNAETGEPLAYAKVSPENHSNLLTNIDGSFSFELKDDEVVTSFSYVGFATQKTTLTSGTAFVFIELKPSTENLETVLLTSEENPSNRIIKKAIAQKNHNNPEKALNSFAFKSYNKFLLDNELNRLNLQTDSTNRQVKTIINTGAAFLSEKVTEIKFEKDKGLKENITGIRNAGFEKPAYEILSIQTNPFSLYNNTYEIFKTTYAGPLANKALKYFDYKILDTTKSSRPAYVVYFKPKKEEKVAGLEGILYLDTVSYAIQEAKAQLLGEIKLETEHEYTYFKHQELWFPGRQITTIQPGKGGKEIAVFGGAISVGRLQKSDEIINQILGSTKTDPGLFLTSETVFYDIDFEPNKEFKDPSAEMEVSAGAFTRPQQFWENNRQINFSEEDKLTEKRVERLIDQKNIERKITLKNAITSGYYPVGFWNFKLSHFYRFNNYEGIRLGVGGRTNDLISKKFNINGYLAYGTKDERFKYGLGTEIYLHKPTGTNLKFNYSKDIFEVGSYRYLTGEQEFSIFEPRLVNISFFYSEETLSSALTHRFTSRLKTELRLSISDISTFRNYAYTLDGNSYNAYRINEATISFLWRPFSSFLKTNSQNILTQRRYPKFTGQVSRAFTGILNGDFNFTKAGLKIEHEIKRIDRSRTEFILEGNYAIGDLPLTHAFHAFPNNANRPPILRRFSVAGNTAFETMYFNEFFSDKQAMLHVKHHFRPINLHRYIQPEIVLISRHVIGGFADLQKHENIAFKSLEHGYSEAGLEINNILSGFGLAGAYRYGAYNLEGFDRNFALKFTFILKI